MSTLTTGVRFREQTITFANGATGRVVDVPSASPRNYHQAISKPGEMPRITIDGQLFLPPGASGAPGCRSSSSCPAASAWRPCI